MAVDKDELIAKIKEELKPEVTKISFDTWIWEDFLLFAIFLSSDMAEEGGSVSPFSIIEISSSKNS